MKSIVIMPPMAPLNHPYNPVYPYLNPPFAPFNNPHYNPLLPRGEPLVPSHAPYGMAAYIPPSLQDGTQLKYIQNMLPDIQ